MRCVTYCEDERSTVGIVVGDAIVNVERALTQAGWPRYAPKPWLRPVDVAGLFLTPGAVDKARAIAEEWSREAGGEEAPAADSPERAREARGTVRLGAATLLAPVLRPTKVLGVGMNYRPFIDQIGEAVPDYPVVFNKTSSALIGAGAPITLPSVTNQAVPEGELAVIIGRAGTAIPRNRAADFIAGLTCANDVSARNLEFRTSQWASGKMLPTFCPLGPVLVTLDEFADVDDLELATSVNGREVQRGTTADMVFSVCELISELSQLTTLEVGDVVLTGTPSDLGALEEPVYLRDGDEVAVDIGGIGRLSNPVHAVRHR